MLGAFVVALRPLGDPDVWWHLRTGEWILDRHHLPTHDEWSFMSGGHRWVPHEWLSQMLLATMHRIGGYPAVALVRALAIGGLVASLAVQAFRRTTPYRAVAVTVLAILGTSGGWGERPQLASFLLLTLVASVLWRATQLDRTPWWLVAVVWLWANLHGLWFLAPGLCALLAIGTLLDDVERHRRRARGLGLLAIAMLCAGALTPNGPRLLSTPFAIRESASLISEYQPPSVRTLWGIGFFVLVGLLAAGWARSAERVPPSELLYGLSAVLLGMTYSRTVAPAVVMLVPLIAARFPGAGARSPREESPWLANVAIAGVLVVAVAIRVGAMLASAELRTPTAPVAATAAVRAQSAPRHTLVEYGLGGWLLWAAPDASPAIDGRTEIYDLAYVRRYFAAQDLRGDWRALVAETGARVALFRADTPLATGLRDILGWREVHRDDDYVVLIAPG